MKTFKTLCLIRLCFFWPKMQSDIILWVKSYSGCIPTNAQARENTSLVHSWPITTPFAIISVAIWKPGTITNNDGYTCLLNSMCDMTQFVVVAPAKHTEASYLARLFMESILLKFGLCIMVVIDQGSEFQGVFKKMCKLLNIRYHSVAKRNHKAVSVEWFHKFLNYSQHICTEECCTSAAFVKCTYTTAYAWNTSPIDGTDIIRSVPAISCKLKFPLDIHESPLPPIINNPTKSIVDYIQYLDRTTVYAREICCWITEDRRTMHRKRTNNKRNVIEYKKGDIVMGRVAIQRKKEKGAV